MNGAHDFTSFELRVLCQLQYFIVVKLHFSACIYNKNIDTPKAKALARTIVLIQLDQQKMGKRKLKRVSIERTTGGTRTTGTHLGYVCGTRVPLIHKSFTHINQEKQITY
jgi:hypothetical protein